MDGGIISILLSMGLSSRAFVQFRTLGMVHGIRGGNEVNILDKHSMESRRPKVERACSCKISNYPVLPVGRGCDDCIPFTSVDNLE